MGIHSCYKERARKLIAADVVQVDLDDDLLTTRANFNFQRLPPLCRILLINAMKALYQPQNERVDRPHFPMSVPDWSPYTKAGQRSSRPGSRRDPSLRRSSSSQSVNIFTGGFNAQGGFAGVDYDNPEYSSLTWSAGMGPVVRAAVNTAMGRSPQTQTLMVPDPFNRRKSSDGRSTPPKDHLLTVAELASGKVSNAVPPTIPEVEREQRTERFSSLLTVPEFRDRRDVQLCQQFLKMWAYLLSGYRQFCVFLPDPIDPTLIFDSNSFLQSKEVALGGASQPLSHAHTDQVKPHNKLMSTPKKKTQTSDNSVKPFLSALIKTSYFPVFLNERSDRQQPIGLIPVANDAFDRYEQAASIMNEARTAQAFAQTWEGVPGANAAISFYDDSAINDLDALRGWDTNTSMTFGQLVATCSNIEKEKDGGGGSANDSPHEDDGAVPLTISPPFFQPLSASSSQSQQPSSSQQGKRRTSRKS